MPWKAVAALKTAASECLDLGDPIRVKDAQRTREWLLEPLVRAAVFADDDLRETARFLIHEIARDLGVWSASIQELYEARGRGENAGFTVPAINIRGLTYDVTRAALRAAHEHQVGPVIFEIARTEIDYTEQRPAEYAAAVLAAAIRESHQGPVFLQGDHFQVNAARFVADPEKEVQAVRDLVQEAIEAGFLNIDIDTSTLVDLSHRTLEEQQRVNFERAAELTALVREHEPEGVTISVGGEIGEVGKKNSTLEELEAYMDGFLGELRKRGDGLIGPSKISVQTGTSHGGVPLADGSVAKVNVDFDTLRQLSQLARDKYGMSGAVQHGASTLPEEAFDNFPQVETAEIHLATGFQNLIYDHPEFPEDLRHAVRNHCFENHAAERQAGWTDEQFLYKTRKKAFGPLKRRMWDLPAETRAALGRSLEERFGFLYSKLAVTDTRDLVERHITRVDPPSTSRPAALDA